MSALPSVAELLEVAVRAARMGGDHTLRYFRRNVGVEFKADRSPVTQADREAEQIIRDHLQQTFPLHAILGEELGDVGPADAAVRWVVDPLDGTKSVIHGVPLYTTLVGVMLHGRPVAGAIYAPATGELVCGGQGVAATLNGVPCRVSDVSTLADATILTSGIVPAIGRSDAFLALARRCRNSRTWGDGYGYLMVATGRAEIMIDPKMSPWDCGAILPVIQAAGGACASWAGEETIFGGDLYACNAALAAEVGQALRQG